MRGQSKEIQKILVFSDIHLTSGGKKIIGLSPLYRLKLALDHSLVRHPDSGLIVFTGDLAHEGDIASYKSLRKLTDKLTIPVKFMMGNHDQREFFSQVFPHICFEPDGFLQSSLSTSSYEFLFIDTLNQLESLARRGGGFLCTKRLSWLDEKLNEAKFKKVVIFMHHPPFPVGFKAMDRIRLANSEDFFEVLGRHRNVIHIVSGHIHRTISGYSQGHSFSIFKSTCYQMQMQYDSENVKLSSLEQGAYGILFVKPDSLIVHTENVSRQNDEN